MAVETERPSRRRHTEKDQIAHYELVAYSLSPNTSALPDCRNWHRWSAAHRASSPHAMSSRKPGCASHRVPCSFLETCLDINAETDGAHYSVPCDYFESFVRQHAVPQFKRCLAFPL